MGFLDRILGRSPDEAEDEQRRRALAEPFVVVGGAKLLDACERISGASGRFGLDVTNPIPVNGIGGEIVYLNTLRARSGTGLMFHRLGSKRIASHPQPVDAFEVVAVDASQWATLYFSMYYPRRSRDVPEGFDRKPWASLSNELRAMVHFPATGVTSFVEEFPLGLPDAVRASPMLRSVSPGLGESMARAVERFLERSTGRWDRPAGLATDSTPNDQRASEAVAEAGPPASTADATGVDGPEIVARIRTHLAILKDAETTGDPRDYEKDLRFFPPGAESRALNKGLWVCGCCMAPFSIDPEKVGMWFTLNHQRGIPVALCAVCVEFLNDIHQKRHGRRDLTVPRAYDPMGQDLANRFPGELPVKLAVLRMAMIDARTKAQG